MREDIVVLDGFFPPDAFDSLSDFIATAAMTYGSRSNTRTDPHGHWSKSFVTAGRSNVADVSKDLENGSAAPLGVAWKLLRDAYLQDEVLIRCYLNGYTYGTDGYLHADSERPDEHTAILYMNDYWEPDWAGETVFVDDEGDIIKSVLPKRNRVLIFPANIQHAGRSVSRKCTALRKTLILKSRRKRSENFERLSAFLRDVGAVSHAHGSGTLHDHLMRTFSILESKNVDRAVCFAGGLHSIHGTNRFPHDVLTPQRSGMIVDLFGSRAQELVHYFSRLERPKTLESPHGLSAESATVELRDGNTVELKRSDFDDLRKIECANLWDQNTLKKCRNLSAFWKDV